MFKIILFKLGIYQKYKIEYNGLFSFKENQNKTIEFYYYKNCPLWLLKEAALEWLKNRVLSCSNVIYIERINELIIQEQFVF
jgi:transcriptional regulator